MKIYQVKVYWYDDISGEDKNDNAFIFAATYGEAITQLDAHFTNIYKIKIEEVCVDTAGTYILFVPKDKEIINAIRDSNCY